MITCEVQLPDLGSLIVVSFVYAANCELLRRELWAELIELSTDSRVAGNPWVILGDFNETLNISEHSKQSFQRIDRGMRDFRECLATTSLEDLNFRGSTFTWWNHQDADPVAKKLDRILVNDEWGQAFPDAVGFFGEPDFSDHSPSCLTLNPSVQKPKRPFKFFNLLLKNSQFLPLIQFYWSSLLFEGYAMFRISQKLKALKGVIRAFSRDNYSDIEKRTREAHASVLVWQGQMLTNPSTTLASSLAEAVRKWSLLAAAEESYLFQKSRVTWLSEGDGNTAYFHKMVATRRAINHVHFLVTDGGTRLDSQIEMMNHCVDYFGDLLGSTPSLPSFSPEEIDSMIRYRCSPESARILERNFSHEEIREALFSLPRNKCSGPDGYSPEFFMGCWSVVGPEFTAAVDEFFSSGMLLNQWNSTTLALIPKIPNASRISEFRPISLTNTVYKVISKLLAGRLKKLLPEVISHSQSAFLPGRLLAENVLLATEIIHGYGWKNISPSAMLKVDLRKAFDSVRWDFVIEILQAINIPPRFVNWISQCITTPSFSISLNGQLGGFFKSTKGLRQGDAMSPYLFVLVMEIFSSLLHTQFVQGHIGFHPNTAELQISHLMFADDVMIFFDGTDSSLQGITSTLQVFAEWSGLSMNREKTELYYAGLNQVESSNLAAMGFPIGTLPIRYLGLPLMHRKLRLSEYSPLLDKITKRFKAWAVRSLSFAGRLQLISSVIYGLVNFWSSAFLLPKGCVKRIEALCTRFLWTGDTESGRGAKVAWHTICLPKKEGGLGLRRLSSWNTTLLLRFIWLLFSQSGSLWVAWFQHHKLRSTSFWALTESANDSWGWKTLLRIRPLAETFLKCVVGNGRKASFWFDSWTPLGPLIKLLGSEGPRLVGLPINSKVADACSSVGWRLPEPRSEQLLNLHVHLTTSHLPVSSLVDDKYVWSVNGKNTTAFSSRLTWEALRPRENVKPWANAIWFKGATPALAFTMWIAQLDRLPTRTRIASWGILVDTRCCLCSVYAETRDHMLLRCEFSDQVWGSVLSRLGLQPHTFFTWDSLIAWTELSLELSPSILRKLVAHSAVYNIWKERNKRLHSHQASPASIVFKAIDKQIRNTINARRKRKKFSNLMAFWLQRD